MELSKVKEVLRKEFKGKATEGTTCSYKTNDGRKCAIGCFIPEGHEGVHNTFDAYHLLAESPDLEDYMPHKSVYLLQEWQGYHDALDETLPVEKQRYLLYKEFLELRRVYVK